MRVIDHTIRDLHDAWRTFAKAPLPAFTIVVTVAVGLGLVAVLFTVLNALVFRVDRVPDVGEMYAVEWIWPASGTASPLTRPVFDAMRADSEPSRTPMPSCPASICTSTAGGWRSRSSPATSSRSSGSERSSDAPWRRQTTATP